MGFWLGTLVFALIQLVVTLGINYFGQPGNKGCGPQALALDALLAGQTYILTSCVILQVDTNSGHHCGGSVMDHVSPLPGEWRHSEELLPTYTLCYTHSITCA
jgi:hypothetical protein